LRHKIQLLYAQYLLSSPDDPAEKKRPKFYFNLPLILIDRIAINSNEFSGIKRHGHVGCKIILRNHAVMKITLLCTGHIGQIDSI
jgi:hypothetical protein